MLIFSREAINSTELHTFNEKFLEHYLNPGAPNVIILLLIANTHDDPCIGYFHRQVSLIRE